MGMGYRIFGVLVVLLSVFSSGAEAGQKKPWTYLFFVAGDEGDIDPWSRVPLRKLEQVGSDANRWIVAQTDLHWDETGKTLAHEPAKRYVIEKHPGPIDGKDFSTLKMGSPVVWSSAGEIDSSAGHSLAEFIQWAKKEYPADHYALFVLGHSWGWRGIGQDYHPGYALPEKPGGPEVDFVMASMAEFRAALKSSLLPGEKFELLVLDACNDGALEVAYEVRDLVRNFLAAPTEMPFLSLDYVRTFSRPWAGIRQFTADLVGDAIVTFGRGGSQVVAEGEYPVLALVAADMEKMEPLWTNWSAITKRLPATNFKDLFLGDQSALWLDNSWNVDWAELAHKLHSSSNDPEVRRLSWQLLNQLGEPNPNPAFDIQWRSFSAKGTQFVIVEMRADEILPRDKALTRAQENFDFMNPHLKAIPKTWAIEKAKGNVKGGGEDWVLVRVKFPWVKEQVVLRPFIAGGTWARVMLWGQPKKVLGSWVLTHPTGVSLRRYWENRSPYLATAHTFGVGRIRGFTLNLDTVMDLSVPANHHYADGKWLSGKDFYKTLLFSRDFGWGDLLFSTALGPPNLPRYHSRQTRD